MHSALSEIVNTQLPSNTSPDETMKICEYCFLEVIKLKDRVEQKETDSVISSLYTRWCKVKSEIDTMLATLPTLAIEPIAFKVCFDPIFDPDPDLLPRKFFQTISKLMKPGCKHLLVVIGGPCILF